VPYKILYDNDGDEICEYEIKMEPGWSIEEKINYKSGMACKITSDMGATIDKGKEIQLYSPTGVYLWGGVIVDISEYEEIQNILYYDLVVEDYSILTTRSLAKIAYENRTIDYIVKDLINRYLGNTVDTDYDFGIREGIIEENLITLSNQIFNYLDIYQCLDILSQYGYIWNIDKDKKLNFHSIGYQVNDNILDNEAGTFSFYNFKRKRSIANYRNYQLTRGNKMLTNYREDEIPSPLPDGEVKSFTVKFPIAKTPRIEIDGVDQSVGVNGIDSESDFDWFWSYESNIISCSDSDAAPGVGVEIRVNYYGLVPILVGSKNPDEIAANGLYEHYTKNDNLNSIEDALFFTQELLSKYSETADKISFDLYEKIFNPMERFKINHSVFGISNEMFFVESVTWDSSQIDENNIVYHYNVLDGAALGGWEEIFKNMFKPEYVEIGSGDIIVVLEEWDETISYAGTYDITEYDDLLFPDDLLYPDDLLCPNNDSSNVLGGASD
jgi:hypothetical protein